jgi:hypothetical protein
VTGVQTCALPIYLVDRETPKAYYTKSVYVNVPMAENKNSGMVKDNGMQQWAIRMLLTTSSESKRQRLNRCGWMSKSLICLRYSPFLDGNFKDTRQQLECQLYCSQGFSIHLFLIFHSQNESTSLYTWEPCLKPLKAITTRNVSIENHNEPLTTLQHNVTESFQLSTFAKGS